MAKVYHKSSLNGGEGGQAWDDDVYEGVRKVHVGQDSSRITYVKFEYMTEEGQVVTREYGKINQQPKEFAIQYPVEHITVVEGNYSSVITNLLFKTSKGRKSPLFGPSLLGITSGKKFDFEDGGKKIVGFHGRSGNALDAFGVYFAQGFLNMPPSLSPLYKLDAQGGTSGRIWDDGPFDGVKAWTIGQDDSRITYVEFEYEKDSDLVTRHHGVKKETALKFVLNPNECITSVEASYEKPDMFRNIVIRSLKFETSEGRRTFYGYNFGKKFLLEQKGLKLVGFHGREGSAIDAFGAYFAPVYTPTHLDPESLLNPLKRVPAIGGEGGDSWDDGVYDDVRKIFVGLGNDCVAFVKFEYLKDQDIVLGDNHGKQTLLEVEEFWLGDGEYLTTIDGYYDKINGIEEPVITCLRFKTNRKESIPYGLDCGEKFTIGEEDHKIVGFHGQGSHVIHSIGVTLAPVTPTE